MNSKMQTLDAFSHVLSSSAPTPGGGSAAALTGSLAASLTCMVASLTIGKKAYQSVEADLQAVLTEATRLRDQLLHLIDTDAEAFNHVMVAMKLPQTTESEKAERKKKLEEALKHATEVPFQAASLCYRVLELAEVAALEGNKNAVSDAGAGAVLGEAALQAALLNVSINLRGIHETAFKNAYSQKRDALAGRGVSKKEEILKIIESRLKG